MPQTTVNLTIEDAYAKLKAALAQRGCTIASENTPQKLVAKQGSLWGLSPKTAKKTVEVTFEGQGSKTAITYNSKLSADWKNITIIGCILAFILTAICVWMAMDLSQFMIDGNPSFWGWIVTSNDTVKFQAAEAFVNLSWGLAVFLSIVIALEAAIYIYAGRNIEVFAKDTVASVV
ncbi:MAG TPA: hypothetical protein VLH35_00015 [Candidatus Acidoferrales bacterium]|nr:hypothetical protein [Candidatus Acidoferrales bacterium]